MPKFKKGNPQITFIRRDGVKFTNTFHNPRSAKRALRAWKSKGGKVVKGIKKFSGKRK